MSDAYRDTMNNDELAQLEREWHQGRLAELSNALEEARLRHRWAPDFASLLIESQVYRGPHVAYRDYDEYRLWNADTQSFESYDHISTIVKVIKDKLPEPPF